MQSAKKPRNMAELVEDYGPVISKSIAQWILIQAEVKDAMSFAIGVVSDPRFRNITRLMEHEDIWKYWTERDMKFLYDKLDGKVFPWLDPNFDLDYRYEFKEALSWKYTYLWCRLFTSYWQFYILNQDWVTSAEAKFGDTGTMLQFDYLNTFTVKSSNSTVQLDFRDEWPNIYTLWLPPSVVKYLDPSYNASFLKQVAIEIPLSQDFAAMVKRYNMSYDEGRQWDLLMQDFYRIFSSETNTLNFDAIPPLFASSDRVKRLSYYPRVIERGKILLGSRVCASCESTSPKFICEECTIEPTYYCGESCQDKDLHEHIHKK